MFFIYTPQNSSPIYYDPEEAFLEYKRREYVKELQDQPKRALFERELQLEKERHEAALVEIARKETARRQRMAQLEAEPKEQATNGHQQQQQPQDVPSQQEQVGPTPREILARRLARQKEEERRSRQFHQHILSHIFGVPPEGFDESEEDDDEEEKEEEESGSQPTLAQLVNEFSKRPNLPEQEPPVRKQSLTKVPEAGPVITPEVTTRQSRPEAAPKKPAVESETDEPHWSSSADRARALAEISSINRTFHALKSTFVFPSGPLEHIPGSDTPRLAFNSTNATIHAYEYALADLLSKLDDVESYGFKGVREARKQLVTTIEQELEDLEKKTGERLSEGGATTSVPIPAETPESKVEKNEAKEEPHVSEVSSETPALPSDPVKAVTIPTPVTTPAVQVPLPETADEELEVADAIHIDVTDDESNVPSKAGK